VFNRRAGGTSNQRGRPTSEVVMSLLTRVVRSAGLDRNPLRRASDRLEAYSRVCAVVALTVTGPALAWIAGYQTYRDGVRIESAERVGRHQTEAVLLQVATDPATPPGIAPTVLATASWALPDGTIRTGWVPARAGTTAGAAVPLWIDAQGLPTPPPRMHDETVAQTTAAVLLAPLALALLVGGTHLTLRTVVRRRQLAQWNAAWLRVEPHWSGRDP
jgi:hypothetical protein